MQWGVFQVYDDSHKLVCVHVAPCGDDGYILSGYDLSADSDTIERTEMTDAVDGAVPMYVHYAMQ